MLRKLIRDCYENQDVLVITEELLQEITISDICCLIYLVEEEDLEIDYDFSFSDYGLLKIQRSTPDISIATFGNIKDEHLLLFLLIHPLKPIDHKLQSSEIMEKAEEFFITEYDTFRRIMVTLKLMPKKKVKPARAKVLDYIGSE